MLRDEVAEAFKIVQDGGIILYPTDTIWGIGCDATNTEAVKKIYRLKQRDETKSMIILLDAENKLESYVSDVNPLAYDLIEYAENPLTLVLPGARNISPAISRPRLWCRSRRWRCPRSRSRSKRSRISARAKADPYHWRRARGF